MASLTSYYTFYLIHKFNVSVQDSQLYLFIFLVATAIGTLIGGPVGDRIGRKYVIWASILGAAPFSLLMPHANLMWTIILSFCVGLMLSSAFPAILLYAQELLPTKLGLISGLFFGFLFFPALALVLLFWGGSWLVSFAGDGLAEIVHRSVVGSKLRKDFKSRRKHMSIPDEKFGYFADYSYIVLTIRY